MPRDNATLVYRHRNNLYVNLTNECPTACSFCIKRAWKMDYRGYDLFLKRVHSAGEYAEAISAEKLKKDFSEIVFCGYGEPTMKLDLMLEICNLIRCGKVRGVPKDIKIRLNTNGLGNAINRRNIVPELAKAIDAVSISVNAADGRKWAEIMNPAPEYAGNGFESVLEFIRECADKMKETSISAIDMEGADIEKLSKLAKEMKVKFRLRPAL